MANFRHGVYLIATIFNLLWMVIKGYTVSTVYYQNADTNVAAVLYISSIGLALLGTTSRIVLLRYTNLLVIIVGAIYSLLLLVLDMSLLILTSIGAQNALEHAYFLDIPFISVLISIQDSLISLFFMVVKLRVRKMNEDKKHL